MSLLNTEPNLNSEQFEKTDQETVNTVHQFVFTGDGGEYFRIWIINLCLTMATLGIYSAWAKVRRLQYFDRNTQLDGFAFNFHGDPMAIFKGRVVALVLFVAYHYAFGFSKTFGATVIAVLFVTLPWMLRSALRFRLRNTSYRGLRFHFNGDLTGAYLSYTPLLALILLPAATAALMPEFKALLGLEFIVLYLSWPIIHAAMKRYQQAHISYGDQASRYDASAFSLIKPYLMAFLFAILIVFVIVLVAVLAVFVLVGVNKNIAAASAFKTGFGIGFGIGIVMLVLYIYGVYLVAGPFLQVRIWNLVWNNTHFPDFSVHSDLQVWPYLVLQTKNLVLTLLTLGLYRPYAVVQTYRYRLSRMTITGAALDRVSQTRQEQISATGDSSADFFGIDLSF